MRYWRGTTAFGKSAMTEASAVHLPPTSAILLAASRGNPSMVLKQAATAYNVDTDAIAAKVKQESAAKEKAKKTLQPTAKTANKTAKKAA